jgi:aromatic-L-amino-acid decarboxylase
MTAEEFRQAGHALIDWIADYRTDLEKRPVRAQIKPGEVSASFPAAPPKTPQAAAQLLQELESGIVPGITQVQHPMHCGWFPLASKPTRVNISRCCGA